MIDTIKVKINREELPDNCNRVLEGILEEKVTSIKDNGMASRIGWFKNFRISIDDRQFVLEGSLTKYTIGDNLHFADKEQLRTGIIELSRELNINLLQGSVTRLDIAGNIVTRYPVKEYYQFLIDLNKSNRQEQSNGLSFANDSRYVSFYGKIKEMKRKRDTQIDQDFIKMNILRYEYRYSKKKTISDFLKIPNPVINDIFDNYDLFVNSWVDIFEAISKKVDFLEPSADLFLKKGEFHRFLKRKGIEASGGTKEVLNMIEMARGRKYLSKYPNKATNLKRSVKSLMSVTSDHMRKSTLVEELEEKIRLISFCACSHN